MTALAEAALIGQTFRIGDIVRRSASLFGRRFVLFAILAALAAAPELILTPSTLSESARSLVEVLAGFILGPLTQAAAVDATIQESRGGGATLGGAIARAWARFAPTVTTSLCTGFAVIFGAVLLIVPGVIALTMFYVAVPVCVMEERRAIASLKRSAALTKGQRWRLLALGLLVIGGGVLAGAVLIAPVTLALGALPSAIAQAAVNELLAMFLTIVAALAYEDLRVLKDGVDAHRISAIFD